MVIPPARGRVDPLFLHELALELKMPVGEMCARMSAHELAVSWPAYFRQRDMIARREQEKAERAEDRRRRGFED